jgi:hypothetical protein
MNEVTLAKSPNFDAVRAVVERLAMALIGLDLVSLVGHALPDEREAAE